MNDGTDTSPRLAGDEPVDGARSGLLFTTDEGCAELKLRAKSFLRRSMGLGTMTVPSAPAKYGSDALLNRATLSFLRGKAPLLPHGWRQTSELNRLRRCPSLHRRGYSRTAAWCGATWSADADEACRVTGCGGGGTVATVRLA